MKILKFFLVVGFVLLSMPAFATPRYQIIVDTIDAKDRADLAAMGLAIDAVDHETGQSYLVATIDAVRKIQDAGFAVTYLELDQPKAMDGYHTEAEVDQYLTDLTTAYPNLTHRFSIGTSIEGRSIECLKISDNAETEEGEPGFFLVARHHAREPLTTEMALETAKRLLENYATDDFIRYLVDEREIYIVPRHNMDGATYDENQGYTYWRKNRRQNAGQQPSCWGVDLNRNYGYEWGHNYGSSSNPCDETYRGTASFSEPEAAAVRDFFLGRTNVTLLISLHTYGEWILYPWGYTYDDVPDADDHAVFETTAALFAEYNDYMDVQGSDMYPTSGDTCDWAYGDQGIFCYTFELSPDGWPGFYPGDWIFTQVFNENFPVMELAAAFSEKPEMVLSCGLWRLALELDEDSVTLTWAPIVETDGSGYDVLRADTESGPYSPVNGVPIALGQEEYQFEDFPPLEKAQVSFWYKIRYNSTVGRDQEFGPLQATFDVADDDDDAIDDDATDDDATDDDATDDDATDDDDADDDATDDDTTDDDVKDDDDDSLDDDAGDDDDDSDSGCCG